MIFNSKCVHCFKNNCLIAKQSEPRFRLSQKKKQCFLRVIDKEQGHGIGIVFFLCVFLQPIQRLIILPWLIHEKSSLDLQPDRTTASSFDFLPLCNNLWLQRLCESDMRLQYKVVNFGTADVSGVRTYGARHPALTYHNAKIENIPIEVVTKSLSCREFYILRIYFLTHRLLPKTTTVKFSPQSFVNL